MRAPRVVIIVLTWNQRDLTLDCLASIDSLQYPRDRLLTILVDNASQDGTVKAVRDAFPDLLVLHNSSNLGYASGNNVGIQWALERKADYVCILNNDTVLAPDCLQGLVDEAECDPQNGLVGPRIYCAEPSDMIFAAGSMIDWKRGKLVHRGIWQRETEVGPIYAQGPEDVEFVIGCCMLVKRRVIEHIGLLDAQYYLNFEDVDWCLRARQAGYRVRYTPRAVLWHRVSASLGLASPRNTYYMTRNGLLFFGTHLTGWQRWRALARIAGRNVGHIAAWTVKPEYRSSAKAKRDANILALRDALLRRFGPMGPDVEAVCRRS